MKKVLLFIAVLMVSMYAIGQKTFDGKPGYIQCGDPGPVVVSENMGNDASARVMPETDYMSLYVLPSTGSTSGNARIPRNNTVRYQREMYLIMPSEMAASGYPNGALVSSIGWLIATAGVGTQTGTLNIWLMNTADVTYTLGSTWNTAGFTQVHSDAAFTVPIAAGSYEVPFNLGVPFTYTGGGVYIAWEFVNEAGALPSPSTTLVASCNTNQATMCYGYQSATAQSTTLAVTAYRPATIFGTISYTDILGVSNIYALEKAPIPYSSPNSVGVRVTNVSGSSATYDLTLTVKDATNTITRYTSTQTGLTIAANSAAIVYFNWSPAVLENINIEATASPAPGENFLANNTKTLLANVNDNLYSYTLDQSVHGGFGYGGTSGAGIFASKFTMNGAGIITGANLFIPNSTTNTGKTIYAVAINSAGAIVAQSADYVMLAGDLGTNVAFPFITPVSFVNETFYVGLAQPTFGYYPVGTFSEIPVRPNTFFIFNISGGTPIPLTGFDLRYGIEPLVTPYVGVVPPSGFTATAASPSQINLNWTQNANTDPVMLVFNTTNTFGTPANGTAYAPGNPIPGGGTVIFNASATTFSHTGLTPGTTYYYQAFSVDGTNTYSVAKGALAATFFGVPYFQDFNGGTTLPVSWSGNMTVLAGHGVGGTNALSENLYSTVTSVNASSPNIVLSANQCKLSFDYRIVDWDGYPATATVLSAGDKVEVQMSTNGGTSYSTLYTINTGNHVTSTDFAARTINLAIYPGAVKFRFLCSWAAGDYYVDIDNFLVEELPLCAAPTNLTVNNVTMNSAIIGWSNAPFVEIDYGPAGHPAGSGTIVSPVVNNPHTLTGLAYNTTYDVYVRQDCGSGVISAWVGPLTFKTLDLISIAPSPYDFGSVGIGASSASQTFTITNNGPATTIESVYLSGADMGNFILTDGNSYPKPLGTGASFTVSVVFQPGSPGVKNAVLNVAEPEVAPYTADLTGTGVCSNPSALTVSGVTTTSASLGWTANGTTAWEIEYGLFGFTPGTGTLITAGVTNPYYLSGLSEGTSYSFYVRAVCQGGYSAWVGPASFYTLCNPFALPYSENFDAVTLPNLPFCWTRWSSAAGRPWMTSNSAGIGAHSSPNFVGVFYHPSMPKNEWLVSPPLQVNAGTNYVVKFWLEAPGYGYPEKLKLVMSSDPSIAALLVAPVIWNRDDLFLSTYTEFIVPFTAVSSGTYYFAWHAYSVADVDYIAMDDVSFMAVEPLQVSGNATNATCPGTNDGAVNTLVYGGVPPYTFNWSNGANTQNLSGLAAGEYSVTVTDALNTTATGSWSVMWTNPVCENITVTGTLQGSDCYDALQVITVAGGGTTFVVESTGNAIFIAGQKILYLPGTSVLYGGYMLGTITQTGQYCNQPTLPSVITSQDPVPALTDRAHFTLYPNPTNGNVILVQKGDKLFDNVKVVIYSVNGTQLISSNIIGQKQQEFRTADLPDGLYIVKVFAESYVETIKLVKTR